MEDTAEGGCATVLSFDRSVYLRLFAWAVAVAFAS